MFDKIPVWFTWKKTGCLFEYPEYKVYSFVAIRIMFKAYHLFKVCISLLSYPSTKSSLPSACTCIFYPDISITVKNNLISIAHWREDVIPVQWWDLQSWFLLLKTLWCISHRRPQLLRYLVSQHSRAVLSFKKNSAACHWDNLPKALPCKMKGIWDTQIGNK